jgi:predicted acyltransferase
MSSVATPDMASDEISRFPSRDNAATGLPAAHVPAAATQRLVSLDALRGFDMFWIIGADGIVEGLRALIHAGYLGFMARPVAFVENQLTHRAWAGLAFEDLIFPLFVFIVGVSIVFSLTKALSRGGKRTAIRRIVIRSVILYFLGLMVYHGFDQPLSAVYPGAQVGVRWMGVLQRIAICYLAAALLFCFFRPRVLLAITVALLIGYWLLMTYVRVPGVGRGSYVEGRNLANYLDEHYLPGRKWDGKHDKAENDYDPEGILSTMPAIATCLLGVFAGLLMRDGKFKPYTKVAVLLLGGAVLAGAGYAWGFLPSPVQFPVVKKLWTSSFVLCTAGYGAVVLALFYLVIDVWKLRAWAMPFVWIGTNAITLYMVASLGFANTIARYMVGSEAHPHPIFGPFQILVTAVVELLLMFVLARFLYRRGVFIRV